MGGLAELETIKTRMNHFAGKQSFSSKASPKVPTFFPSESHNPTIAEETFVLVCRVVGGGKNLKVFRWLQFSCKLLTLQPSHSRKFRNCLERTQNKSYLIKISILIPKRNLNLNTLNTFQWKRIYCFIVGAGVECAENKTTNDQKKC